MTRLKIYCFLSSTRLELTAYNDNSLFHNQYSFIDIFISDKAVKVTENFEQIVMQKIVIYIIIDYKLLKKIRAHFLSKEENR